jgi:hypothetical protein
MNPLLQLALQETPAIIAMLRQAFQKQNPDAPLPSDAEVIAAYESAFRSSLAKDAAWLAAHPA